MKRKIGIINHWMVNNYGALYLAYALERKIREMGYDVETISWLPDEVRRPWQLSMAKKPDCCITCCGWAILGFSFCRVSGGFANFVQ